MDQLIWRFKGCLKSLDSYHQSNFFKQEIDKGNRDVLMKCLSEIQIILSQPNENPYSKLLSLRFCKDIMLLGKPEIITGMERIIPAMTKIASYRMESKDPNRGITYFRTIPKYSQMTGEQKKDADMVGASLVILALENIKMWAKWIPTNMNGSQSIFKKSYDSLVERGVVFPTDMSYYKQNDTEKFNQTYKVEFFQNSDFVEESQQEMVTDVDSHLRILQQLRQSLKSILVRQSPSQIHTFHRKVVSVNYDTTNLREYLQNTKRLSQLQQLKKQQRWIDSYLQNYQFLNNNRITYEDFSNAIADKIPGFFKQPQSNLQPIKREEIQPVIAPVRPVMGSFPNSISHPPQIIREQFKYQQIPIPIPISSQQERMKISTLEGQLRNLQLQKQSFRAQIDRICLEYESKLNNLRQQIHSQSSVNEGLSMQIVHLKRQIEELLSSHSQQINNLTKQLHEVKLSSEQRIVSIQHIRAQQEAQQMRKLKLIIDQQRLQKGKMAHDMTTLRDHIFKIQEQLQSSKVENQNIQATLDKYARQKKRLVEEISLYKSELSQERTKIHDSRDAEMTRLNDVILKLNGELQQYRHRYQTQVKYQQAINRENKLIQMHKKNFIAEDERRRQTIAYHMQTQMYSPSPKYSLQASKSQQQLNTNSFRSDFIPSKPFIDMKQMIAGMEEFYTFFVENPKQLKIRFCRAALKNKQLLFKSNQLQVGVIWSRMGNNRIKAILHYTNNSTSHFHEFKSTVYSPKGIRTQILSILPPTLPANEQQKEEFSFEVMQLPLRKVVLQVSYIKNQQPKLLSLLLPIFLLKFVEYSFPRRRFSQLFGRRKFNASSKLIKNLPSYFEQLKELDQNSFQTVVTYHPASFSFGMLMRVQMDIFVIQIYSEGVSGEQSEFIQEYMNELQYVLS